MNIKKHIVLLCLALTLSLVFFIGTFAPRTWHVYTYELKRSNNESHPFLLFCPDANLIIINEIPHYYFSTDDNGHITAEIPPRGFGILDNFGKIQVSGVAGVNSISTDNRSRFLLNSSRWKSPPNFTISSSETRKEIVFFIDSRRLLLTVGPDSYQISKHETLILLVNEKNEVSRIESFNDYFGVDKETALKDVLTFFTNTYLPLRDSINNL